MPARRSIVAAALVVIVVAGCTAAPSASMPSVPPATVGPSAPSPRVTSEPVSTPTAAPSDATPTAAPTAAPTTRGWSEPFAVQQFETNTCEGVSGAYGPRSDIVLVTTCDGDVQIAHARSADDWEMLIIEGPDGVILHGAQVAFDGDRLFVAADLLAPEDGGCGDPGLRETGIRVWSRDLQASGPWAAPLTLGGSEDHLQSFRVVDGVIHATVRAGLHAGEVAYLRSSGRSSGRVPIADAIETSLRVGSDGVARVAYTTPDGLRLATMDAGAPEPETIYRGTDAHGPTLVLAGGNEPILMWSAEWGPGGCAEPDPLAHHGTYVFSDVLGVAASERLTTSTGASSLTLDIPGGMAYVVTSEVTDERRGTYLYSRPIAGGEWTSKPVNEDLTGAVMRVDQASGGAFLAWIAYEDDDTQRLMVQTADLR